MQLQGIFTNAKWHDICALDDIVAGTGVAARLNGEQLAVFNTGNGIFAIGNLDPFSGANVLARGLLGDIAGVLVVASPVYKQHFCLQTGRCLEDPEISVPAYQVRVCEITNRILIRAYTE
ncbi:MAG: nitrite reductase small subunit NirD [Pseudohongiella sp.]|nr:nitrite reductase small subunit NirD [Pseudohongiella sp.]